jgi:hypothetical protein
MNDLFRWVFVWHISNYRRGPKRSYKPEFKFLAKRDAVGFVRHSEEVTVNMPRFLNSKILDKRPHKLKVFSLSILEKSLCLNFMSILVFLGVKNNEEILRLVTRQKQQVWKGIVSTKNLCMHLCSFSGMGDNFREGGLFRFKCIVWPSLPTVPFMYT